MTRDEETADTNPYSAPQETDSTSRPPCVGSFTVGAEERLVQLYWSYWSGLEVYTVDGVEIMRTKNYEVRGTREFDVGGHHVVIKVDGWPSWRILLRPWDWIAEAYIDGELAVEDVTPMGRDTVRSFMASLRWTLWGTTVIAVLIGLLVWMIFYGL